MHRGKRANRQIRIQMILDILDRAVNDGIIFPIRRAVRNCRFRIKTVDTNQCKTEQIFFLQIAPEKIVLRRKASANSLEKCMKMRGILLGKCDSIRCFCVFQIKALQQSCRMG